MWRAKSPYKLTGPTKKYVKTSKAAISAVLASKGKLKGYTRLSAKKYQLNTGSEFVTSVGHIAVELLGKFRTFTSVFVIFFFR